MTSANILPPALSDGGILYSNSVPITSNEADLYGGSGVQATDPVTTSFGEAISAIVQLSINGLITANNTYVIMQMDMGDGVWVDMNWLVWTASQGSGVWVFSNGVAGNNTFQQTRKAGSAPASNGNNQVALGGRIRFVGQTNMAGGSSSLAGITTAVSATIRYRIQSLR